MTTWLIIFCMGLVTYAIRLSLIAAIGRIRVKRHCSPDTGARGAARRREHGVSVRFTRNNV